MKFIFLQVEGPARKRSAGNCPPRSSSRAKTATSQAANT